MVPWKLHYFVPLALTLLNWVILSGKCRRKKPFYIPNFPHPGKKSSSASGCFFPYGNHHRGKLAIKSTKYPGKVGAVLSSSLMDFVWILSILFSPNMKHPLAILASLWAPSQHSDFWWGSPPLSSHRTFECCLPKTGSVCSCPYPGPYGW